MSSLIEKTTSRRTPSGQLKWKANFKCHLCDSIFEREYANYKQLLHIDCGCGTINRISQPNYVELQHRYSGIKSRCKNGGRTRKHYSKCYEDVEMCEEWLNSFKSFYDWAVANGFSVELHIDRIDGSLGYSPDNCRFITQQQNNRNGARSKLDESDVIEILKLHGEYCNLDIASEFNITPPIICNIAKGRIWKDVWEKHHTDKNIKRACPSDLKRLPIGYAKASLEMDF